MSQSLIDVWKKIIVGKKSWVLFENGTCVILMAPEADLAAQATAILKEWGPVHAGGPAGDFSVIKLANDPGWVVTGHHPDVLNYISPDDVGEKPSSDLPIGLGGRSNRGQDAAELHVIHIEDWR